MKTIEIIDLSSLALILSEIEKAGLAERLTTLDSNRFLVDEETYNQLTELIPYADWEVCEYE